MKILLGDIRENRDMYVALFLVHIGLGVAGPVLSDIKNYFGLAGAAEVSLVFSAFGFARLICDLPGSLLIQRVKHESLLVYGAALLLAGSVLVTLAPSYDFLLAGRMVAGIGSSLINISALSILNLRATSKNRGRILSLYSAFSLGGTTLGPGIGGLAALLFGWRGSFGAGVLAAFLALASVIAYLSRSAAPRPEGFGDGSRAAGKAPEESKQPGRVFITGAIAANASTFVFLFALEGFNNTAIPLYGGTVLGLGPGILGITLGFMAVARFVASFFGGIMSDRYGRGAVLIPGLLMAGTGAMALRFALNFPLFVVVAVIFSVGRMANNVNLALVGDVTQREKIGFMIGVNRFLADLGLTTGPWFMGMAVDRWGFETAGLIVGITAWATALLLWKVFGAGVSGCDSPVRKSA